MMPYIMPLIVFFHFISVKDNEVYVNFGNADYMPYMTNDTTLPPFMDTHFDTTVNLTDTLYVGQE